MKFIESKQFNSKVYNVKEKFKMKTLLSKEELIKIEHINKIDVKSQVINYNRFGKRKCFLLKIVNKKLLMACVKDKNKNKNENISVEFVKFDLNCGKNCLFFMDNNSIRDGAYLIRNCGINHGSDVARHLYIDQNNPKLKLSMKSYIPTIVTRNDCKFGDKLEMEVKIGLPKMEEEIINNSIYVKLYDDVNILIAEESLKIAKRIFEEKEMLNEMVSKCRYFDFIIYKLKSYIKCYINEGKINKKRVNTI